MHTKYAFENDTDDVEPTVMSLDDAIQTCAAYGGDVKIDCSGTFEGGTLTRLETYLRIWNHTEKFGNILLSRTADNHCQFLKVHAYIFLFSWFSTKGVEFVHIFSFAKSNRKWESIESEVLCISFAG